MFRGLADLRERFWPIMVALLMSAVLHAVLAALGARSQLRRTGPWSVAETKSVRIRFVPLRDPATDSLSQASPELSQQRDRTAASFAP